MPVFLLDERILFPPPDFAEENGLLAVDGDLSVERLLLAYKTGIFPWYGEEERILWWSPNPRAVITPDSLRISKSLARTLKKGDFQVRIDFDFDFVIRSCSKIPRKDQNATWIGGEMIEAYLNLHRKGHAHSFETYYHGKLAGGLYGVSLGKCFFGESMFHFEKDASKIAMVALHAFCRKQGFELIDCQMMNPFLERLGAFTLSRENFLEKLRNGLERPAPEFAWKHFEIGSWLGEFTQAKLQ